MLPAHAGMIPRTDLVICKYISAPRTCGDDPGTVIAYNPEQMCSPHMRG